MRLFIAEKPSVARVIAEEMGITRRGDGYVQCGSDYVTWCVGHMFEQAEPDAYLPDDVPVTGKGKKIWREQDLPIIPQVWKSSAKKDLKPQLKNIGDIIKNATTIVHAGDPDREGQLLVDAVIGHFRAKQPVLRYLASAQDSTSVKRGLADLKKNADYVSWGLAAKARGQADWLIGMNITRALTLSAKRGGGNALLVVGRVQTPTLALVVARDRAIEAFKPVDHYKVRGQFDHPNSGFEAEIVYRDTQSGLDFDNRLIDKKEADRITALIRGKDGVIVEHSTTPKKDPHPRCYSLADITLAASKKFSFTADETLEACQALYDAKFTTYPRTDCPYLPEAQYADVPAVLASLRANNAAPLQILDGADPKIKSKTWDDSKITAHHGIIPTMHRGDISSISPKHRQLYDLIVATYLAQFYPLHEYTTTEIGVQIEGERFKVTGKTILVNGWKDVYPKDDDKKEKQSQPLPQVKKGDTVHCSSSYTHALQTKAPDRFNDGTLIKAMENIHGYVDDPELKKMLKEGDGIGTSATRASIVKELKRRGLLETKGKSLISSAIARNLIDTVPDDVRNPSLTAYFERILKVIETTGQGFDDFMRQQEDFVKKHVAAAAGSVLKNFVTPGTEPRVVREGPFVMSEAQAKFLARIEEAAGVKATDEQKADFNLIKAFIDEHKPKLEASPPSAPQLKFAKDLAAKLPPDQQPKPETFNTASGCRAFIDSQLGKKDAKGKGGKGGSSGSAKTTKGAASRTTRAKR